MNDGKVFEHDLSSSIPADIFKHRINDPAQSFGSTSGLRFSPHNGYDFEIFQKPNLFCLELKSTKNTSMSIEREGDDKKSSPMIKLSQIKALEEASKYDGIIAGFVLNWRNTNQTYFLHIKDFLSFYRSTGKKSINQIDVLSMRHVLINQTLKRTHYSYDIEKFILDAVAIYS